MKTQFFATVLVATIGFVAAPSFAADNISGEVGYVPPAPVASSNYLTRAMVQTEYVQAQRGDYLPAAGEGADIGAVAAGKSDLTRAAVRAEAAYALRHGQIVGGEV